MSGEWRVVSEQAGERSVHVWYDVGGSRLVLAFRQMAAEVEGTGGEGEGHDEAKCPSGD